MEKKKPNPPKFEEKNSTLKKMSFFVCFFMFFRKSYQCKIALEIFFEFAKIVPKKTHLYTVERLSKK